MAEQQTNGNWQERYRNALLGVFGNPQLCLDHGQGCVVVDNDGKEYLDLLAGIAVNALGLSLIHIRRCRRLITSTTRRSP